MCAPAAETKRRRLAWLVQAKFRGPRRFCSALRGVVAPETVRRARRGLCAIARGLPIRLTTRRPLIKRAAAAKPGTAVRQMRSASPSRQRPPGVLPAPVTSLQPSPPPARATPPLVKDQIDRSK